jgi:xanthine/CO dehydrogenase XdhC/CoxF family maturation factor
MKDVWQEVGRWARRGDRIAIAIVVGAQRSAPRPLGTKMAINHRGEIAGAVSGGCVEGAVVEIAERVIDSGRSELAHFGIADSDAWGVGLPCGGEIELGDQPLTTPRVIARFLDEPPGTRAVYHGAQAIPSYWAASTCEPSSG